MVSSRILLDRIVLEVLVAAVAVDEMPPLRVPLADAAAQREAHRRAFDVERLVVLEDAQRLARRRGRSASPSISSRNIDSPTAARNARACSTSRPVAEIQHERLQPRRRHAEAQHRVIGDEEHRAAVDAARKSDADRRRASLRASIAVSHFAISSASAPMYRRPISSRSGGQRAALGREEPGVGRDRIGTADERELDDVVRRHHARVARMKLARRARRAASARCSVSMRSAT